MDFTRISRVQISPWTPGTTTYCIGPLSTAEGKIKPRNGMPLVSVRKGRQTVQDFVLLDKRAYGPFTDGSATTKIRLDVERDPERRGYGLGLFRYTMDEKGWCGFWLRCGDDWNGQDWRGAKSLRLEYQCEEPLFAEIGFNDRNQNAYVAFVSLVPDNGAWGTVDVPFKSFRLNRIYQPREARKGYPQDLSRIETFNVSPRTPGDHSFKLREVTIKK